MLMALSPGRWTLLLALLLVPLALPLALAYHH
jgi:hypothetical protein